MRLYVVSACLMLLSGCATVSDYYEIHDLSSSSSVQAPLISSVYCWEDIIACDDDREVFYAIRRTEGFSLRTISYGGVVLEEKGLSGFDCHNFTLHGGFSLAMSPDKRCIAYWYDTSFYLYDLSVNASRWVLSDIHRVDYASWVSPSRIIYCGSAPGTLPEARSNAVVALDPETGKTEVLYEDPAFRFGFEFCSVSPDGTHLLASGRIPQPEYAIHEGSLVWYYFNALLIDLESRTSAVIEPRLTFEIEHASWSQDSLRVVYYVPLEKRVRVMSIGESQPAFLGSWDKSAMLDNLFFSNNEEILVSLTSYPSPRCGPSAIKRFQLLRINLSTGKTELQPDHTYAGRLACHIANGTKLLAEVDDDRDFYTTFYRRRSVR